MDYYLSEEAGKWFYSIPLKEEFRTYDTETKINNRKSTENE